MNSLRTTICCATFWFVNFSPRPRVAVPLDSLRGEEAFDAGLRCPRGMTVQGIKWMLDKGAAVVTDSYGRSVIIMPYNHHTRSPRAWFYIPFAGALVEPPSGRTTVRSITKTI